MAVGFVFGRSGAGKTRHCTQSICECLTDTTSGRRLILLVPEQASYQAERSILSYKNIAGFNRLHVLSFNRLEYLLLGKKTALSPVSKIGQQMIIQKILTENISKLKIFRHSAEKSGFGRQMTETIKELIRCSIEEADFDKIAAGLKDNDFSKLKFFDIRLVFGEYLKFIEGRFSDPDVQLRNACRQVEKNQIIKDAQVWVDGFSGFTASEFAILVEIIKNAADTHIALCLDAEQMDINNADMDKLSPTSIFYPTEKTYCELLSIIKKLNIKPQKPVILKEVRRFQENPALGHIEKNIFNTDFSKRRDSEGIRVIAASSRRTEAQFAAAEIAGVVRKKGLRYRDIAVIATNLDSYENYLKASFEEYGLPYFIDKRKSLSQHPVIGLLRAAFASKAGGFSNSDVFTFLKNDLSPLESDEDIDLLENYCVAFGVNQNEWISGKDWQFDYKDAAQYDEKRINEIRKKACSSLLILSQRSSSEKQFTCGEFTKIVFEFLNSLEVWHKLQGWINEANTKGDLSAANEHLQFYDKFVDIFDEMTEIFGELKFSWQQICDIADSAFSQMTLGFIPPAQDQILIGSIERSRHPDLKAVFFIGATQRDFPNQLKRQGLFSDDDKCDAKELGFDIGIPSDETLSERQYLAYIGFTRPSKYLYISYPMADDKGAQIFRSQLVSEMMELFTDLKEEAVVQSQKNIEDILSKSELTDILCARLGKDSKVENDSYCRLLSDISNDESLSDIAAIVSNSVNYENSSSLGKDTAAELYQEKIKSSATKLSSFAACPYKYFAGYLLGLKKREEFALEAADIGEFYHKILDRLVRENKNIADLSESELADAAEKTISQYCREDAFIKNFINTSEHNRFTVLIAVENLKDFIIGMQKIIKAGAFRPIACEISFGMKERQIDSLKIKLPNHTLELCGKIDRIDCEGQQLIVFDYKKGQKSFSWSQFYHGLDMQLVIYLLAAENFGSKKAIGAFYLPIEKKYDSIGLKDFQETPYNYKAYGIFNGGCWQKLDPNAEGVSKNYNFGLKKDGDFSRYSTSGVLKPEHFDKVLALCREKIAKLGERIAYGDISIFPYRLGSTKACDNCDYKPLCRFDWQINTYNYIESLSKEKFLGLGEGEDG